MSGSLNIQGSYLEYEDLIKVLYRLAVCIKPENYPYLSIFIPEPSDKISLSAGRQFWTQAQQQIDLAEQVSKAAILLSSSFQDSTHNKPQFMRFDFTKRSVLRDSSAEQEGEKLLSLASQRCEKEYWYCFRHYRNAMTLGEKFLNGPITRDAEDNLLIPSRRGLIPIGIGFNPTEIVEFLNKKGIELSLETPRYQEDRWPSTEDCIKVTNRLNFQQLFKNSMHRSKRKHHQRTPT
jgi:hypothetical protein